MKFNGIIKKIKDSFAAGESFSEKEFNQTDFGRIYFNLPRESVEPRTAEELAETLRRYNRIGKSVTIRNTGHSVNGQTLTSGVQVNIGKIKKLHFDEKKLEVTAGAGNTWDEVLRAVHLPKYCLPIFPNNPNQEIKIGGTASVGGVGPYSSKHGGFWNHVLRLKLVTMEGDVIECSRRDNPDYFRYALGGFGRIGVISELTVKVVPSKKYILGMFLMYYSDEKYYQAYHLAMQDNSIDGIIAEEPFENIILEKIIPKSLFFVVELEHVKNLNDIAAAMHSKYHESFDAYVGKVDDKPMLTRRITKLGKRDFVYYFPFQGNSEQMDLAHPWCEFIMKREVYPEFLREMRRIVERYGMQKYLLRQSIRNGLEFRLFGGYGIKRLTKNEEFFPLSLDLPKERDYALLASMIPSVPSSEMPKVKAMTKELHAMLFEHGGRIYLYGYHDLTKHQLEKQFGRETIHHWQKIKDKLDSKHLLNIGVIEHLDNW